MLKLRFFSDRFLFGMVTQWIETHYRVTFLMDTNSCQTTKHGKNVDLVPKLRTQKFSIQYSKMLFENLMGKNQDGLPILFGFSPTKGFKINILRMSNPCNIYGNGGTQIGSRCSTDIKIPSTEKDVLCSLCIRDKRLSSLFLSSLCGPKHNVFLCPF